MSFQQETPQPFRWHYVDFDDRNFQIGGSTLFFIIVTFSIILLVALVFLYARWACRLDLPRPPPTSSPGAQLAHAPQHGLDSAAINSLPIVLHKISDLDGGKFREAECCICLGLFGHGDEVKVLPHCCHCFHSECVDKWLTTQSSCPLCRTPIRVDSPV